MQAILLNSKGDAVAIISVSEKARGPYVMIRPLPRIPLSAKPVKGDMAQLEAQETPLVQCESAGEVRNGLGLKFLILTLPPDSERHFPTNLDGMAVEKLKREAYLNGYIAGLKARGAEFPKEKDVRA